MKRLLLFTLILLVIPILSSCTKESPLKPPVEGEAAPDFTLKDLAGKELRLADLQGRVVMLNFWATWCPPCREEIPSMVRLNNIMAGKQFQMVTVSIDEGGKEKVAGFLTRLGATLPVLLDTDKKIGKRYGLTGVPETFIIDKKGVILKKIIGPLDWSDPMVVRFIDKAISQQ